jgi:hypothetical protein
MFNDARKLGLVVVNPFAALGIQRGAAAATCRPSG